MTGWIALHRSDETAALMAAHPQAFLLLCQIALRAKLRDCPIRRLKVRQALIGDWKEAGLASEKSYRVAKERLTRYGLATFQPTNKGTVATLVDSSVFTLTGAERDGGQGGTATAGKGRAEGRQGATNKKERIKKEETISLPQTGEGEREGDPIPWEKKIYDAYPRRVGKAAGLKAIRIALRSRPPESLLERTQHYAKAISWQEPRYIPHPATWFGQERFDDDPADWEDPDPRPVAGVSVGSSMTAASATSVTVGGRIFTQR